MQKLVLATRNSSVYIFFLLLTAIIDTAPATPDVGDRLSGTPVQLNPPSAPNATSKFFNLYLPDVSDNPEKLRSVFSPICQPNFCSGINNLGGPPEVYELAVPQKTNHPHRQLLARRLCQHRRNLRPDMKRISAYELQASQKKKRQ